MMTKRCLGFGLSELLIALFISSLMMTAICQLYLSVKNHYIWYEKQLDAMQERLLLIDWLTSLIHKTNAVGCFSMADKAVEAIAFDAPILPKHIRRTVVPGSTVIKFNMVKTLYRIQKSWPNSSLIILAEKTDLKKKQTVMVGDCLSSMVTKISAISRSKKQLSLSKRLKASYTKNAMIARYKRLYLYIRNVSKHSTLYLANDGSSQEISRDIESITIKEKQQNAHSLLLEVLLKPSSQPEIKFLVAKLTGAIHEQA